MVRLRLRGRRRESLANTHGRRRCSAHGVVMHVPCKNHPDKRATTKGMCDNCYKKWRYDTDPAYRAKRLAQTAAWSERNRDAVRASGQRWRDKEKTRNPGARLARERRRAYGVSYEDTERLRVVQGDRCAICGVSHPVLRLDHCHASGDVPG